MHRAVDCFYPGSSFPAISITGRSCALNCKHCSKKYLEGMVSATTPGELIEVAEALAERGARGFLLSGGSDISGKVRIADFAEAIEEIKNTTDLKVNAHIGLTPPDEIQQLVKCGIDSFSVDVYGSEETIHDVLGLKARPEDYMQVIEGLRRSGAKVIAPHICVGIHGGRLVGEDAAIERLKKVAPDVLILISLIPTKGTEYCSVAPPSNDMILSVIRKAKADLPYTKLILGCMRSKMDRSSEFDFVEAGLNGIVLPASSTVERLKNEGYSIKKRSTCCSLI
jgi:uncharacterized radical SAM superfamily protein